MNLMKEDAVPEDTAFLLLCQVHVLSHQVLGKLNQAIEAEGNQTENQNGTDDEIKLEYLTAIYDQISQPPSGGQKFANNDTD